MCSTKEGVVCERDLQKLPDDLSTQAQESDIFVWPHNARYKVREDARLREQGNTYICAHTHTYT